jgi:hypothetical protein
VKGGPVPVVGAPSGRNGSISALNLALSSAFIRDVSGYYFDRVTF